MRKTLLVLAAVAAGCGSSSSSTSTNPSQTATPAFSPAAGTYATAQSVTITCATAGSTIYFTTDGTTPTASSQIFSSPISVASTGTVKAIATAPGKTDSAVASATYTITPGTGGGGGGGGGAGTTDFPTLCQGSLTSARNVEVTCLHANPDFVNATLTSGNVLGCDTAAKEIAAGRVAYDATKGSACAAAFASLTCAQLDTGTTPTACAGVLTGKVANGGSCFDDQDCTAGSCNTTAACPGTCQAFVQLNGACGGPATCAPGLECDSTTLTCLTPSPAGGVCPCQGGLFCDIVDKTGGAAGTCKAKQTSGACTSSDQCVIGFVCVGTPDTCQSQVGLGGDCTVSDELCGLGFSCDPATKKCVSFPKLGEACTSLAIPCIASYCDFSNTQKCAPFKHVGDACNPAVDFIACEPGSSCDQATAHCLTTAATTCQAP